MQPACLKSKVKGTKDIKCLKCLPAATSFQGWGRAVDKCFTRRGKQPKSRVSLRPAVPQEKLLPWPSALCVSKWQGWSAGIHAPLCCSTTTGTFLLTNLKQGTKGHCSVPMGGSPWPGFTHAHHSAHKHSNLHAARMQRPTYLLRSAEARVHTAPRRMASRLVGPRGRQCAG